MSLRRYPRFPVHFRSTHSSRKDSTNVGTVVELSLYGCRIESRSQVFPGMSLSLQLEVPGQESPIQIDRAEVRWVSGPRFGLDFMAMQTPEFERLRQFLYGLQQHETP